MVFSYVPCEKCGALNRVTGDDNGKKPVCGTCKTELSVHDGIVELSGAAMQNLVKNSPIPVLVDFWAPWCGPCKMFAPIFSKVALRNLGKAVFAKLNTDEYQIAAQTYGIRGIPTMVIFHNGSEIGRQTGALPEPALVELVGEVVRVTSAQKTPKTE